MTTNEPGFDYDAQCYDNDESIGIVASAFIYQ